MAKEFLKFGDVEIEKRKFHCSKSSVTQGDVHINKILISEGFLRKRLKEKKGKRISSIS